MSQLDAWYTLYTQDVDEGIDLQKVFDTLEDLEEMPCSCGHLDHQHETDEHGQNLHCVVGSCECTNYTGHVFEAELSMLNTFDNADGCPVGGNWDDVVRWDPDDDMKALSRMFPGVTFRLDGQNDEDQYWRSYYREGKMWPTYAKLVYEPYDPSKLE